MKFLRWRLQPWTDDNTPTDNGAVIQRRFLTRTGAVRWGKRHYRHAVVFSTATEQKDVDW